MRHKHYDCIVSWASGETIEVKVADKWCYAEYPSWDINYEYRIKKEPVIEVKYFELNAHGNYIIDNPSKDQYDLKITYQDGKAIKAEVAE